MKIQTCGGGGHQSVARAAQSPSIIKPVVFKMSQQCGGGGGGTYSEQLAMKSCFKKLRQLVPSLAGAGAEGGGMTEVELIQHVIDYIRSLEDQLDTHPLRLILQQSQSGGRVPGEAVDGTAAGLQRLHLSHCAATTAPPPTAHRAPLIDPRQLLQAHTAAQPQTTTLQPQAYDPQLQPDHGWSH